MFEIVGQRMDRPEPDYQLSFGPGVKWVFLWGVRPKNKILNLVKKSLKHAIIFIFFIVY